VYVALKNFQGRLFISTSRNCHRETLYRADDKVIPPLALNPENIDAFAIHGIAGGVDAETLSG